MRRSDGTYDVYFPGDGKSKENLAHKYVKPCEDNVSAPPIRRGELIGKDWWFEGDEDVSEGMFRVRMITCDNSYRCTRLTGTGVEMDDFDIGHVMNQVRLGNEQSRQM